METALINVLNGIAFGMILFVIASGLAVIYGFMGIINLAHGALYMLGAYFGLTMLSYGAPFVVAILVAGIGVGLIGLIVERLCLKRLHQLLNEQVLVTLGFVYIFTNLARWVWGPFAKIVDVPAIFAGSINIGDAHYPVYRLVLIAVGLAIAAGLWFFTEKTRTGSIIRAGMDDKEMTIGLGVNYGLVSSVVFFAGAFVAGAAGFIALPIVAIHGAVVWNILLLSLIVLVVGGVGRVEGILLGAIAIGLIDSLGKAYFPDFAYFTIYLVMILILLVKPGGLLPRRL